MKVEKILNLIAPHYCLGCGQEGSLVCEACSHEFIFEKMPTCYKCNALSTDYVTCLTCRASSPLMQVWVASEYSGIVSELIRRFKYERVKDAHTSLATILDKNSPYIDKAIITSVPTATIRTRVRGYDHAELIAKEFSKVRKLPYVSTLKRTTQHQQVGSDRSTRKQQLNGVFRIVNHSSIKGADIVIIDDVLTTGATLEECARTLKAEGARSVLGVVVAKK